jgi:hypothetical protein
MRPVEFWRWWLTNGDGRRYKSSWRMTAEDAAAYPGAERVEGSCEVRMILM